MARALDHCVLPVASLSEARARYEALGFTVAPVAEHPFGTANACVYFADDTYLEPLAIVDAGKVSEAREAGSAFLLRDAQYRTSIGQDGFAALVFKSQDAAADDAAFRADGISGGAPYEFSRDFVDPAGASRTLSFRLAFAASPASEDCYFFTCERVAAMPSAGREAFARHANGVTGIAGIVMEAPAPADHSAFLAMLTGADPLETDGTVRARLANGALEIGPAGNALRLSAIRFHVADRDATEAALRESGVTFDRRDGRLVVEPAHGQGATFLFEETGP